MIAKWHPILIASAILVAPAPDLAARNTAPVLNVLELQRLVERGDPADNARLSAHFAALAREYDREAARHTLMSNSSVGNPSRAVASGMTAHCHRLADLNKQSAATARELALHHRKLGAGMPSTLPNGGAGLQGGIGAREPTDAELRHLAANASSAAAHRALQEYFSTLAARYTSQADEHVRLAQTYRGTRLAAAALHEDTLARLARDSGREALDAAAMHKQLAGMPRRTS